jgi:hypothetical protein
LSNKVFVVSQSDRAVLRSLAGRVADLAARTVEDQKRDLWYRHNALEPTRPVILCDPENGWNEIIRREDLECHDDLARSWEWALRREIFWGSEMQDDRVIEPCFNLSYVFSRGDWGMRETKIGGEAGGAYVWDSPLKSYDDLGKLRFPELTVDYEATQAIRELANSVLGDILEVRMKAAWWWSLGMTWTLVKIRGLSQIMYDMLDHPAELHKLMAFLRDGHMAELTYLEDNGLLSLNNNDSYVGSGGFGWTRELPQDGFDGKARLCDMWGFAESQETVGVSPDMFAEFIFPYQLPMLQRFGLNCYGCCEPLDERWETVRRIPRLRRVSVSSWSNLDRMAEKLQGNYVFSMKPNPSNLAWPSFDENRIRAKLRADIKATRGCRVEIIMKDCHTICRDPQRVIRWTSIAREESERA